MQARTVWVTPDVIVDKKLAPPTGVPAKRLKHCDAENLGGISGQLDSDKFRVALSSGLFFSCGLTGVFENINIGGRVIHLNPSSVNLEDVHCGQPTSDFFGLKFAGNFPSLEDRSSTIWSWASNTHSSYRRFCTMFRRLPDNHRQKVTVTQRAHRGLVRVENPCEEVNKTRRGFVNQKHTRTSIFELLIGSFSAGGLVQHIQLPENITNRRFNWVPGVHTYRIKLLHERLRTFVQHTPPAVDIMNAHCVVRPHLSRYSPILIHSCHPPLWLKVFANAIILRGQLTQNVGIKLYHGSCFISLKGRSCKSYPNKPERLRFIPFRLPYLHMVFESFPSFGKRTVSSLLERTISSSILLLKHCFEGLELVVAEERLRTGKVTTKSKVFHRRLKSPNNDGMQRLAATDYCNKVQTRTIGPDEQDMCSSHLCSSHTEGVEQSLKDIEYADDTAPLESDADVMQIKLNNLNNSASRFGTRFTPEKANREPCPECPARRILVHRLRSTYEMHTFDRLACQKSEVQMPAYVADDVVLFINWYSYPTLAVVPSGKLISTRNWILEMNKQVDSQFLLGCEERIPRITTTSKEGVDYDKYTNLRIHLVLLDSPGTQLSSAFITYIHVSRYLKYRSKWNMRRPGTAHSVDWKHHKREIQLGSRKPIMCRFDSHKETNRFLSCRVAENK
ncbi:hypothetical protein CLF_113584 [Clonorchis sinensis]|uniref:Uncharacterized protein n=1 Tax=Clonorchis sinensis TaxID=79923 RepID=G7YYT9_CLOSI|nr:hypothetical protein CLF_113584 [Clonorchis sinensis]